MNEQDPRPRTILLTIFAAVALWGAYHVAGAYRANPENNHHPRAASLVIAGCFLAFLSFWGLMLWLRQRRLRRAASLRDEKSSGPEH